MKNRLWLVGLATLLISVTTVQAHYPWLVIRNEKGKAKVHFYFEEAPRVGDGYYLDPFLERAKTWVRTVDDPKPQKLILKETKSVGRRGKKELKLRWLSGDLSVKRPRAISMDCLWDVYTYGKQEILLHYYPRHIDVTNAKELDVLAGAPHLDAVLVPRWKGEALEVQLLWKGKPAANRPVRIGGPGKLFKNVRTDNNGKVSFTPKAKGLHIMRTYVQENEKGKFKSRAYDAIRHHATLTVNLPLK
ncbi:MAG: hypothetical protein ACFCD0_12290 [Gemmataceae bacterium]